MPLVVYKLGGSLLTLADLDHRLDSVFERPVPLEARPRSGRTHARVVLVGGGAAADVVRDWDTRFKLGAEQSHDLALAAMALNARLVTGLIRNGVLVARKNSIGRVGAQGKIAVLDPPPILAEAERRTRERLPRSWDVTSDSIASFLAIQWRAAALVLIKSTPKPAGKKATAAARGGLVDRHFPRLADRLPLIAWVNLRSKPIAIERWL